jgi:hypothetical protein
MNAFNISATLNVFRLIAKPTLCLPHATVCTFNHLPIPLNKAFGKYKNVDIKAVVLDKDNCFAYPESNEIHKPYNVSSFILFKSLLPKQIRDLPFTQVESLLTLPSCYSEEDFNV